MGGSLDLIGRGYPRARSRGSWRASRYEKCRARYPIMGRFAHFAGARTIGRLSIMGDANELVKEGGTAQRRHIDDGVGGNRRGPIDHALATHALSPGYPVLNADAPGPTDHDERGRGDAAAESGTECLIRTLERRAESRRALAALLPNALADAYRRRAAELELAAFAARVRFVPDHDGAVATDVVEIADPAADSPRPHPLAQGATTAA